MQIMSGIPTKYEKYCDTALAMYDGGWRAEDREQMIDELVNDKFADDNDRWTEEEVDIVCYLLERIENN